MRKNVILLDRLFRFIMAGFMFYWGEFGINMWSVMGAYLLVSSLLGQCAMYSFVSKNHLLKTERFYLDELPKNNPEPIIVFCPKGTILFQNKASKAILPKVKSYHDIFKDDPKDVIKNEMAISSNYKEDEKIYQFEARGLYTHNHILSYGFNITDIIKGKEKLRQASITDSLTGLGNRTKLKQIIASSNETLALITLDIIKFGEFNAFYGHAMGNELLQTFASYLEKSANVFEKKYELFRLQSNTYAILIYCQNDEKICTNTFPGKVSSFVEAIREHTFKIRGISTILDVRVGVAINTEIEDIQNDGESLMGRAEATLQEAKKRDISYVFYRDIDGLRERYSQNLYWSNKLKEMFIHKKEEAKLKAYFQPIFNIRTKCIEKYEALARIEEGEEVISPFKFLDAAKQLHLLPNLTKEMIDQSLLSIKGLDRECSINFTAQDLQNNALLDHLETSCQKSDISYEKIVVEILEDEDIYDFLDTISSLKSKGFKIAVDDFGVGYSNFQNLQLLEPDYIKIDGSLVKNIVQNQKDLDIIKSIVTYAKTIGAKTIAEFVSDEDIYKLLEDTGIDYAQGYYIGAPNPKLQEEALV